MRQLAASSVGRLAQVRTLDRSNFTGLVLGAVRCGYRINHQKLMVPEVLFQTWSSKTCIPESSLTGLARASLPEKVPKRENEFRGAVKHLN